MPRKPQLPGAADFFALSDSAPAPPPEGEEAPAAAPARKAPAPMHPELLPPLTLAEGPTEKVTFYLSPLLLKRLELFKAQLLVNHNLKVNRSQILDYLLQEGLLHIEGVTEGLLARAE